MLAYSNGVYYDPYQGNQVLFSIWTNLICHLFKDHNIVNVYNSEETQRDVIMDVVLQISENQCDLQVFRKKISARLETTPVDRTGHNNIIYAQDLVDAWIVLERIWQKYGNQDGDEIFLIVIPTHQANSETVRFVRKAWKQLYYFSVLVADTTIVQESSSRVHLNVLIGNPYNLSNDNSDKFSFRDFKFTEESTKADWIHMNSLLKNRLKNLKGYPLKIIMHPFRGLSEPVFDQSGKITEFKGIEGVLVNEYAKFFNFTAMYSLPKDGIVYGTQLANGSLTGAFKDMEDGLADIHGNSRRFTTTLKKSQYLKTTQQITIVVIVPKALPELKIIGTLLSILDRTASKVSILFIVFNIIVWTMVKIHIDMTTSHKDLKPFSRREKFNALVEVIMNTVCVVSNVSFQIPSNYKERIFYAGLSIWALAVTNIYIGTITTRLASRESVEIDTMEQLQQSGLNIACMKDACDDMVIELDKESVKDNAKKQLTVRQRLAKRLLRIHTTQGVPQKIAYSRDTALVCPRFLVDSMVEDTLSKEGAELIRVMKEPLNAVFFSQIVRRGLPLLRRLEKTHISLVEGGLLDYWYISMKHDFVLKRNQTSLLGSSSSPSPLILENFRFTFLLWGFLTMISIIIFIVELLYHWIKLN